MPFAARTSPSTALSQLKAELARCRVTCDVRYLNFAYADALGGAEYDLLAEWMPPKVLGGEWVFAECLFGDAVGAREQPESAAAFSLGAAERTALSRARGIAEAFLATQLTSIDWDEYDLVGFTSSCEQNLASLALARLVKRHHPCVIVAFGGANWESTMGVAQLTRFPFVDVAFLGEADEALPATVMSVRRGAQDGLAGRLRQVDGIAYRDQGEVRVNVLSEVRDMDRLATPDFTDYFEALSACGDTPVADPHLWLQGSRGCWWAQSHPCHFCGLNGSRRRYRSKSPRRILAELRSVASSWPGRRVDLADTIVSPGFLDEVVPVLAREPLGVPLWLEVRPELTRAQVRAIAAAGGEVQIGIESLSDRVLRLMGKGSRVLECLRLLKWCRDEGLRSCWNLLIGIPGEEDLDYRAMIRLLPALHCLTPPTVCMEMQLERFSPFHARAADYGLEEVRATEAYGTIYPWPDDALDEVAYTFDYRRERSLLRRALVRKLHEEVRAWQEGAGRVDLSYQRSDCGASVIETRTDAEDRVVLLDAMDALLYEACDDIGGFEDLVRLATLRHRKLCGSHGGAAVLVETRLQRLVAERIVIEADGRYLGLASVPRSAEASAV